MEAVPQWEFDAWCEWRFEEDNKRPKLIEFQLMRIAMLVERSIYKSEYWGKLDLMNPSSQLVPVVRGRDAQEGPSEAPRGPQKPNRSDPTPEERKAAGERWRALMRATGFTPRKKV